jgi:hypothetical protein
MMAPRVVAGDPAPVRAHRHGHGAHAGIQDRLDRAVEAGGTGDRQQLVGVRQEVINQRKHRRETVKDLRAARPEQVHGHQRAALARRRQHARERRAAERAEHVRPAHVQHVGLRDQAQVHVVKPEVRGGPGHVERRALPVRPDGEHGRRGLHAVLAGEVAGVHAMLAHERHQQVTGVVRADRAHRHHAGAQLGQVDGRARGRARGGQPDLLQQHAALAGRDRGDGTAEDVEDVRAEAHHERGRGRQRHGWPPGPRARSGHGTHPSRGC